MTSIVFVDKRISNYSEIIQQIGGDAEYVLIGESEDGLARIAQSVNGMSQLDAIHIISHGDSGELHLGANSINADSLSMNSSLIKAIGASLSSDGDILLYGCNIAADAEGQAFIRQLAMLSSADVAASVDATGSAAHGGDWDLEYRQGNIEAAALPLQYDGLLPSSAGEPIAANPRHTLGEYKNTSAFAAIKSNGAVVAWGNPTNGGDSSAVANQLNGCIDVKQIYSTYAAFAALREDGSVVTWGATYAGGDSNSVTTELDGSIAVQQIFSTWDAFAALRADGSVVAWGNALAGGDSSSVSGLLDGAIATDTIFSTREAFAALRADGSLVTWGSSAAGGNSSSVANKLDGSIDVVRVYSTDSAFAALRADGSVVTWGDSATGGTSNATVTAKIDGSVDVVQMLSTNSAFAALRADGSVVTWGNATYGGNSSAVAAQLDGSIDVVQLFSNDYAFAALRADGSVVSWKSPTYGGDTSLVASQLDGSIDVTQVYSSGGAFAALRTDGSVVTWGSSVYGGYSGDVATMLDGSVDVTQIFSTYFAFAALRSDGSVVTWGNALSGGDSSAVAAQLDGSVDVLQIYSTQGAFAALRADGSVVTWGNDSSGADSSMVAGQLSYSVAGFADIYSNEDVSLSNTLPSADDRQVAINEDTVLTFAVGDFGFNDADVGNSLQFIVVDSLPVNGVLALNGVSVTVNQEISAAGIADGLLTFMPAADAFGADYAHFGFRVSDGLDLSLASYTMTIDVTAVNDAPTIIASSDATISASAGSVTFSGSISFGDADTGDTRVSSAAIESNQAGGGLNTVLGQQAGQDAVFWQYDLILPTTYAAGVVEQQDSFAVTIDDGQGGSLSSLVEFNMLVGSNSPDVLIGDNGWDVILGGGGADILLAGDGADYLDGGAARDSMAGGNGDDWYIVDASGDKIIEMENDGNDSVQSSVSFILSANVENLYLVGDDNINGTGNALNNLLVGNAANNILNGGLGADTLIGGQGNDIYWVDDPGDTITELADQGVDTIKASASYQLGANLENLVLLAGFGDLNATGNDLDNSLTGNEGNNLLIGGSGRDKLLGGDGDDTYLVNLSSDGSLEDLVSEIANAGTDTLIVLGQQNLASAATLRLGGYLENFDISQTGDTLLNITGNSLANTLTGNDAANIVHDGGVGAGDIMLGGLGDDSYIVNNSGDQIVEVLGEGTDQVNSSVDFTLAAHVENLLLTGVAEIGGTGNDLNNTLTGNIKANQLSGGDGNDILIGKAGNDFLTGGAGADIFWFDTKTNVTSNVDTIADFVGGEDRLYFSKAVLAALGNLGQLSANDSRFTANSTGLATTLNQRLVYNNVDGHLYYDSNGSAQGGAVLVEVLTNQPNLNASDIWVV